METYTESDDMTDRTSNAFLSFNQNQFDSNCITSIDDEKDLNKQPTTIGVEMQIVNNDEFQSSNESVNREVYSNSTKQLRIVRRESREGKPIFKQEIVAINITFLYLEYITKNPEMKKWLLANIFLDIFFRFSILILFCYDSIDEDNLLSPYRDKSITPYFIIFVQLPRILHMLTTSKLMFMDKYHLDNRSYLPMSYVFRANFIDEICPRQEDLKPINYKDNILSFKTILFILLPIELQWIAMYPVKNKTNATNTFIISSYILKSIEVMVFEPILLILLSFQQQKLALFQRLLFGLILLDILKFVILNMCLIIFSNVGKYSKVKI